MLARNRKVDRMGEMPRQLSSEGRPEQNEGAAQPVDASYASPNATVQTTTSALTGTTIGPFLVGERLGGGAMAAVYRAQDTATGDAVAVKVLLPGADTVMQARFRREARLVSTLVHPHIVRTLDVGRSGGTIYIAMELVEGASLGDLLERHGKLPVTDVARILAPVAAALGYAHEQGIVHRDVKPSNILLQRAAPGEAHSVQISLLPFPVIPLLSDFGIARALDAPELTNAGRTIGTPAFMAPEQCAGSAEIDGRADVYALGAVLYRCLVGRPPFAGTTTQILHAHVYDPLLIPDAVAEALPPPMVRLMARAMMKDPAQRFGRIEQMAAELQMVADLPILPTEELSTEFADTTHTMASLPVAQAPGSGPSRVLVPAAAGQAAATPRPGTLRAVNRPFGTTVTPPRVIPVAPPATARDRSRRSRWGMVALVGAFGVLVLLAVGMLVNSVLPGLGEESPPVVEVTATVPAVAQAGTPAPPAIAPVVSPEGTPQAAQETNAPTPEGTEATPAPSPTGPTPTPQPPVLNLEFTWNLALADFNDGNWADALDNLNLVARTIETANFDFEEEINPQQLSDMLVTSNVSLAIDAAASGQWQRAIEYLNDALEITPSPVLSLMADKLEGLAELQEDSEANNQGGDNQDEFRKLISELAGMLQLYATQFENLNKPCFALIHVENAIQLAVSETLEDTRLRLEEDCADQEATAAVAEAGGYILYSTGSSEATYTIWKMPVAPGNPSSAGSSVLLNAAAQPQLSPNGLWLAYYSRAQGNDGLFEIGMTDALATYGSAVRLTDRPEDSRDSPPSWNSSGTEIAFSASYGESAPRIYITSADNNPAARDMGFGRDPAWNPLARENVIVFNGPDYVGQNPGLYAMPASGDGRDRYALTTNGNDQRPVWSPDGRYIVFMSKDRLGGGSWEIYRMDWATKAITLLTDGHDAQDGVPAVSPDGKWVAFLSDRDGVWRLYYVSIDGGPIYFLSDLNGQPTAWLEHAIQWVE